MYYVSPPLQGCCLVFNISDDNIHDEQGDLREVNGAIRMKVERDVLPEMKRLVREHDVVLITYVTLTVEAKGLSLIHI